MQPKGKATLNYENGSGTQAVEFPIYGGTVGPDVMDIRTLGKTGMFTFDPGFLATASCESAITYIDGDAGVLLYRGYPIEQLAEKCDFLEVAYLLLKGELPSSDQKKYFDTTITRHTMVHEQLTRFYQGFRRDAHPMAVMVGVVGALSAFYHDSLDINDPEHRDISAIRLIAKIPTIAAMCYKYNMGQPFMYPRNDLSYTENFMRMMFATPAEEYHPNPVLVRALDRIFILHADHEQNASTSTVRLSGSSGANPFACIAAGIACLWGPAHGGANEAALNMLEEIGDVSRVGEYIKRSKDKNDSFRLMGFGQVYTRTSIRAPSSCARPAMRCSVNWACTTTACSSWRWNWRRSPWKTNTSSPGSCTRTSISIRASCSARWAFRPACSPPSSPWPAPSAGSRNGTR